MRGSLKYLLLAAVLLMGAVLFACSSDSDDDGDNGADEPTAEQNADDADDNNGDDADDSDDGDDVSADDVAGELREFAERFGVSEFKIVYEFSGGDDSLGLGGQMTMYFKPPNGFRTDITSDLGDIISISRDGTTYSCFAEGGDGQCLESPGTDFGSPFAFDSADDLVDSSGIPFDSGDVTRSNREIAGLDATCYSVDAGPAGDSGEICFSDDGAMLAILDGTGEFGLEAVEVSDSVSDSDFDLPYDVVDLSDFAP